MPGYLSAPKSARMEATGPGLQNGRAELVSRTQALETKDEGRTGVFVPD